MSKEEGKNLCLLLTYTNTLLFPNNHVVYSREGGKLWKAVIQNRTEHTTGEHRNIREGQNATVSGDFLFLIFFLCHSFSSFCVPTRTPCVNSFVLVCHLLFCLGHGYYLPLNTWISFLKTVRKSGNGEVLGKKYYSCLS